MLRCLLGEAQQSNQGQISPSNAFLRFFTRLTPCQERKSPSVHFFLLHGLAAEECRRLHEKVRSNWLTPSQRDQILASVTQLPVVRERVQRQFCRNRAHRDNPEGVGLCASIGELAREVKKAGELFPGKLQGAVQAWYEQAMCDIGTALQDLCSRVDVANLTPGTAAEDLTVQRLGELSRGDAGKYEIFKRGFSRLGAGSQRADKLFDSLKADDVGNLKKRLLSGKLLPDGGVLESNMSSEAVRRDINVRGSFTEMQVLLLAELVRAACYIHALVWAPDADGVEQLSPLLLQAKNLPTIPPADIVCDSLRVQSSDRYPLGEVIDDSFDLYAKVFVGRVLVLEWVLYEKLSRAHVFQATSQWYKEKTKLMRTRKTLPATHFLKEAIAEVYFWSIDVPNVSVPETSLPDAVVLLSKAVTGSEDAKGPQLTVVEAIAESRRKNDLKKSDFLFQTVDGLFGVVCQGEQSCLLYPKDRNATEHWLQQSSTSSLHQPMFSLGTYFARQLATFLLCLERKKTEDGSLSLGLHEGAAKILREAGRNCVAGSESTLAKILSLRQGESFRWSVAYIMHVVSNLVRFHWYDVLVWPVIREVMDDLARISDTYKLDASTEVRQTTYFKCAYGEEDLAALPHSKIKCDFDVLLGGAAVTFQEVELAGGSFWCLKSSEHAKEEESAVVALFKPFPGEHISDKQWKEMRNRISNPSADTRLEFVGRYALPSTSSRKSPTYPRVLRGKVVVREPILDYD